MQMEHAKCALSAGIKFLQVDQFVTFIQTFLSFFDFLVTLR